MGTQAWAPGHSPTLLCVGSALQQMFPSSGRSLPATPRLRLTTSNPAEKRRVLFSQQSQQKPGLPGLDDSTQDPALGPARGTVPKGQG